MPRVTAEEVKEIMDNCPLSDSIVYTYINSASAYINKVFDLTPSEDSDPFSDGYEDIEKWLTAHMIATTRFRQASEEKLETASVKYTGYWSKGLESTSYGQMVLMLDTEGKLAGAGKRSATIYAIKSREEDEY